MIITTKYRMLGKLLVGLIGAGLFISQGVSADSKLSMIEDTRPISKDTRPISKDTRPINKDTRPISKDTHPINKDTHPINKDTHPINKDTHPISIDTHQISKDYTFTAKELTKLEQSSVMILSNDQFVFNNELIALDWDNVFDSYFPHLKDYQDTIMHYAGYYSINPKLLISLIESKSKLVSSPSKKAFMSPFGELSTQQGFKAQTKDVASKLTKRFYAYRKLVLNIEPSKNILLKERRPTSAATVALTSLLASLDQETQTAKDDGFLDRTKTKRKQRAPNEIRIEKTKVNDVLSAYENIFFEQRNKLLKESSTGLFEKVSSKDKVQKVSKVAANEPYLYLPWSSGWSWAVTGGAHGFDGSSWPLSSLDFAYTAGSSWWGGDKPPVYAAHGGVVTWLSSCQMRITHSSGIATSYYHMDNLQYASGSYIYAGTYIGRYANDKSQALCEGGQSTGPHLHVSLLKNGYYQSLQGRSLSGYWIQTGNYSYDSDCTRSFLWKNGYTYCPGTNIYKP